MEQSVNDYLRYLEAVRNFSPHTIRAYCTSLADALAVFRLLLNGAEMTLKNLTPALLRAYYAQVSQRKISHATLHLKVSVVRSWCKWLERQGLLDADPALDLHGPRGPNRRPRSLSYGDVAKLLALPDRMSLLGFRDYAILETIYSAGLRVSELVSLDLDDLDLSEGLLTIHGKANQERIGVLGPPGVAALTSWLSWREKLAKRNTIDPAAVFLNWDGQRLSPRSVCRLYSYYAQAAKLTPPGSPHSLRHSYASHLLANGADLPTIQALLGHRNLKTTCIYATLTQPQLRQVFDHVHPRA